MPTATRMAGITRRSSTQSGGMCCQVIDHSACSGIWIRSMPSTFDQRSPSFEGSCPRTFISRFRRAESRIRNPESRRSNPPPRPPPRGGRRLPVSGRDSGFRILDSSSSLLPPAEEAGQARLETEEAHEEVEQVFPEAARGRRAHVDLLLAVLLLAAELDLEVRPAGQDLFLGDALE